MNENAADNPPNINHLFIRVYIIFQHILCVYFTAKISLSQKDNYNLQTTVSRQNIVLLHSISFSLKGYLLLSY